MASEKTNVMESPKLNEENLNRFMQEYTDCLAQAVVNYPTEYAFPIGNVPAVAARMKAAFVNGSYNIAGRAIKAACRRCSIPHNRTGINEFLYPKA